MDSSSENSHGNLSLSPADFKKGSLGSKGGFGLAQKKNQFLARKNSFDSDKSISDEECNQVRDFRRPRLGTDGAAIIS